jgi:hypothetical protein
MHKKLSSLLLLLLAAAALPGLTGCAKLQARVELKKGNEEYRNEAYTKALQHSRRG